MQPQRFADTQRAAAMRGRDAWTPKALLEKGDPCLSHRCALRKAGAAALLGGEGQRRVRGEKREVRSEE
mgnify:CR=1 FL=1